MQLTLKDFQTQAVADLADRFRMAQTIAPSTPAAVLLNAPTAAGKTIMMTALIERLLEGDDTAEGDRNLVFVWLTDDPELNKQSIQKIDATSSVLTAFDLVPMDGSVDQERLDAGKVYFINTQKLGMDL